MSNQLDSSFLLIFYLMRSIIDLCITAAATRDHVKDNVRRMREIQAKCKQRQEEQSSQPVKPLYRPDKYEHIPAKVTMYMKVSGVITWYEILLSPYQ